MQVVILAAGQSSRFYPFSKNYHKSLTKILGKTILEHTLLAIKKTGIKDIIIVTGPNTQIINLFGDGKRLGLKLTYVVQPEPLGMGDALLRVQTYIKDYFFLMHAAHVDFAEFKKILESKIYNSREGGLVLLAKKTTEFHKSGILQVNQDRVIGIVEKPTPESAPSDLGVVGIYLLHKVLFKSLEQVPVEHYSLEAAITNFAQQGIVKMAVTDKQTVALKYPWDLLNLGMYLLEHTPERISKKALMAKNAYVTGHVIIEDGVTIMEGACIKGPCYLGRNVLVGNNAVIRGGVIAEDNTVIGANMEIKHSLMQEGATTHSGYIGDSVIGRGSKFGANITVGNVRLDRGVVTSHVNGYKIPTNLNNLGIIVGENARFGVSVSTMPGVIIGNNATIGPATMVIEDVEDNVSVYTKFETVIKTNS